MSVWNTVAASCPTLPTRSTTLAPQDGTPTTAKALVAGDTTQLLTKFNNNAEALDQVGCRGGGGYAVTEGLDISASGLTCTVTAGGAMIDGPVVIKTSVTVTLADNAYNWVYLLQGGTATKTSAATLAPPAAPSSTCAFLGMIQVTAGTPATADYSGRLTLTGGTLYRRTSDAAAPADTPPSSLQFVAQTAGGAYWWDGAAYRKFVNTGGVVDGDLATLYIKADGTRAFTGDQSLGSHKLTNVTDPTAAQDAATKNYVDGVATGLDVKASCRAATTTTLPACTYANGTAGVGATLTGNANGAISAQDGVTLVANDRLLVKDQASGLQNGVYKLTTLGTGGTPYVLTRATDADQAAEVTTGLFTFIEEGTVNAGTGWVLTTANPITIGTTAETFTQFSGAGEITAGTGLTKSGNTLNVVANADGSVLANADDVQVGILATDAQHGVRGGGTQHANVVAAGAAGFMTGADKSRLDGLPAVGLIVFGAQGAIPSALTRYLAPGSGNLSVNEIKVRLLVACTAQKMAVRSSVAPGSGVSDVVTVRKNGSDTSLTATLTDTNTETEDTTHTVSFSSGDDLSVKLLSGTLTATQDMMVSLVLG